MNSRLRTFRNALVGVALEEPLPAARPAASVQRVVGVPDEPELHVLIVDDSQHVHELHRTLVRQVRPHAKIHSVFRCTDPGFRRAWSHLPALVLPRSERLTASCAPGSVNEAKEYCKESDASGDYVHLILLDFNLSQTDEGGAGTQSLTEVLPPPTAASPPTPFLSSPPPPLHFLPLARLAAACPLYRCLRHRHTPLLPLPSFLPSPQVFGSPNGFHVAAALDEMEATSAPVPKTFRYKPFVAMVSYLANSVMGEALSTGEMKQDGSLNGCDLLLPKPLGVDAVRTLIEGCGV